MSKTILEMNHISKYIYDASGKPIHGTDVKILNDVHFDVREQEVHILIGENGAGKSTLMKILGGIIPHDEGSIQLFGKDIRFSNPRQSQAMGIGFIHQELDLCLNLDVAQNLFLGKEKGKLFADRKGMYQASREMLQRLGFDIDPATPVRQLSRRISRWWKSSRLFPAIARSSSWTSLLPALRRRRSTTCLRSSVTSKSRV